MQKWRYTLFADFLLLSAPGCDHIEIYDPNKPGEEVPLLQITIEHEEYQQLLNNKTVDAPVTAEFYYQGKKSAGRIRSSGASSRYSIRWNYRIVLQGGSTIEGLQEFNLNSQSEDNSMLKTSLALHLYQKLGFAAFKQKYVTVRINDGPELLVVLVEPIKEEFFKRMGIPLRELYQVGFKGKFSLKGSPNISNNFEKKYPDDDNFGSLADFLLAVDSVQPVFGYLSLNQKMDINQYLLYHAATAALKLYDNFNNNFYLYTASTDNRFRVIPWDFDRWDDLSADADYYGKNEIIELIKLSPEGIALYHQYMKQIVDNIFTEAVLFPVIDSLSQLITTPYNNDPFLGKSGFHLDREATKPLQFLSDRRRYLLSVNPLSR